MAAEQWEVCQRCGSKHLETLMRDNARVCPQCGLVARVGDAGVKLWESKLTPRSARSMMADLPKP